jgi:hypothetical protein
LLLPAIDLEVKTTRSYLFRGKIEHRQYNSVLIFMVCSTLICYAHFFEPELLPLDTVKMYLRFSLPSPNEKVWHTRNVEGVRNRALDNGYLESF